MPPWGCWLVPASIGTHPGGLERRAGIGGPRSRPSHGRPALRTVVIHCRDVPTDDDRGPRLPDPRPGPDKDARLVRRMFDRVAPRYDLANTLFSLGRDRHWRRTAARAAGAAPGRTVVDVAAGTGALSGELADAGATVVAVDFSWRMLRVGAVRRAGVDPQHPGRVGWCTADALRLPLPDAAADAATIAFGLRNLPDAVAGLTEMARVVRPGGRLVVLEFSRPRAPVPRALFDRVVLSAMPLAARLVTSDPAAYGYLADSIRRWPHQAALAALIGAAGWRDVRWRDLTGGVVALHRAERSG